MQDPKLQRWQSSGSAIAGINDGEMEVMRLREENEALMDSLVRTKVELAETEGKALAKMYFCWLTYCRHVSCRFGCHDGHLPGVHCGKLLGSGLHRLGALLVLQVLLMILIMCTLATCLNDHLCYRSMSRHLLCAATN